MLAPYLGWLVDWCYATWYYRFEQDDLAYPFYKSAYESARYSVGQSHYALVNQYIESCAKTVNGESLIKRLLGHTTSVLKSDEFEMAMLVIRQMPLNSAIKCFLDLVQGMRLFNMMLPLRQHRVLL